MSGVSRREAAKALGVVEGSIRKAIKSGRIKELPDGTIDIEDARANWSARTDPARSKVRTEPRTEDDEVRIPPPPPVRTQADAEEAISLIKRVLMEEGVPSEGPVDFDQARTAETILKARERELKMQERRKILVPLAKVVRHI